MSIKKLLIFVSIGILIFIAFFGGIVLIENLLFARPATPERMQEVLNEELNKHQKKEKLEAYIKLLDFLETHKQEIVESVSKKDTSECLYISFEEYNVPKSSKLPKHLWDECKSLIKPLSPPIINDRKPPYLKICNKQFITLGNSYTDRENYLYISHKFYLKDARKNTDTLSYSKIEKEVLIKNKYYLRVKIVDVFNAIDPNNFAPN